MLKFLAKFDRVPRRVIYAVLFVAAGLPFLVPLRLPLYVWKETRTAFTITGATSRDKVVAIDSNWVAGSQGENWPQYEAIVAQCMLAGVKFVVFSLDSDPLAPQMAEVINQRQAKRYGRRYGIDWVNLGLSRGAPLTMGAIGRNLKKVYQRDITGKSTQDYDALPIMRHLNGVADFSCFWVIDYQPTLDWVVFLDPTRRVPILFACAGIVSSGYYPYISSGQLKGMMVGTRGAAEYEDLLRQRYGKRFDDSEMRGGRLLVPLAFGHLVIILFVVIGNVGMFVRRKLSQGGDR